MQKSNGSRYFALAASVGLALAGCSQIDPNDPNALSSTPTSVAGPTTTRAGEPPSGNAPVPASSSPAAESGKLTVTCSYPGTGSSVRAVTAPSETDVPTSGIVTFRVPTSAGTLTITSQRGAAPCSVHSIEWLAKQGFYDATACHRLVTSGPYVLQCGDPSGTGRGGPGYTSADEVKPGQTYPAGTVAMATSGPNGNGSQFFMVYQDSDIPADYTVIGTLDGASVQILRGIANAGHDGSDPNGGGKPSVPVVIQGFEAQA